MKAFARKRDARGKEDEWTGQEGARWEGLVREIR